MWILRLCLEIGMIWPRALGLILIAEVFTFALQDLKKLMEMKMHKDNDYKNGGFVNLEECLAYYADMYGISLGDLKELLEEIKNA